MATQLFSNRYPVLDNTGTPLGGGSLDIYLPNTTTRLTTYQDKLLTIANTNPVLIPGSGRVSVWVDRDCDIIASDSNGVQVFSDLDANPIDVGGGFTSGLLPNGSFEIDNDGNGTPDGWTRTTDYVSSNNGLETGASNLGSGARSWRFAGVGSGGGILESDFVPVNDSDSLQLEFKTRSTVANVTNEVQVVFYDQAESLVGTRTPWTEAAANPASMTKIVRSVTPFSGSRLAKVRLKGVDPGGTSLTGSAFYDDVRLYYPESVVGTIDNLSLNNSQITLVDGSLDLDLQSGGTGRALVDLLRATQGGNTIFETVDNGVLFSRGGVRYRTVNMTGSTPVSVSPSVANAHYEYSDSSAVTVTINDNAGAPEDWSVGDWVLVSLQASGGVTIAYNSALEVNGSTSAANTIMSVNTSVLLICVDAGSTRKFIRRVI